MIKCYCSVQILLQREKTFKSSTRNADGFLYHNVSHNCRFEIRYTQKTIKLRVYYVNMSLNMF